MVWRCDGATVRRYGRRGETERGTRNRLEQISESATIKYKRRKIKVFGNGMAVRRYGGRGETERGRKYRVEKESKINNLNNLNYLNLLPRLSFVVSRWPTQHSSPPVS